jgi:hypothetical protein
MSYKLIKILGKRLALREQILRRLRLLGMLSERRVRDCM